MNIENQRVETVYLVKRLGDEIYVFGGSEPNESKPMLFFQARHRASDGKVLDDDVFARYDPFNDTKEIAKKVGDFWWKAKLIEFSEDEVITEEQRIANLQRLKPLLELVRQQRSRYKDDHPGLPGCTTEEAYRYVTDDDTSEDETLYKYLNDRIRTEFPYARKIKRGEIIGLRSVFSGAYSDVHTEDYHRLPVSVQNDMYSAHMGKFKDLALEYFRGISALKDPTEFSKKMVFATSFLKLLGRDSSDTLLINEVLESVHGSPSYNLGTKQSCFFKSRELYRRLAREDVLHKEDYQRMLLRRQFEDYDENEDGTVPSLEEIVNNIDRNIVEDVASINNVRRGKFRPIEVPHEYIQKNEEGIEYATKLKSMMIRHRRFVEGMLAEMRKK